MSIKIGLKGRADIVVDQNHTALAACSGMLPVFATPYMCALMEEACCNSIASCFDKGESTVGSKLQISHISATPIGMRVWAESEVTAVDGRRIVFKVRAYDEKGLIGEGVHERFIVSNERFVEKAEKKKQI